MKTPREHFFLVVVALCVLAFVLAPIFLMFATSLKPDLNQIMRDFGTPRAFYVAPWDMSLENFRKVLSNTTFPVLRYMMNSAIIVVSIVIVGVFVNSLAAYVLARLQFPGRNLVVMAIIALIIVPTESLAVPLL